MAARQRAQDDRRVQAIAQTAEELVEQRDRWLNAEGLSETEKKERTLTNLYNIRPTWLDLAHKRLNEAVFAAYGGSLICKRQPYNPWLSGGVKSALHSLVISDPADSVNTTGIQNFIFVTNYMKREKL